MADEQRILQLVEELMESRHTPEEVCSEDPELLPLVRDRWQRLCEVEAQVESLFPTPHHSGTPRRSGRRRWSDPFGTGAAEEQGGGDRGLPRIPGYRVEAEIGSGGMGVVYRATHLKLKRSVAIKMLLSGECASSHELACLLREAQSVAGLRHEHIVQVYDVGELDGLPYFTMELIDGGTLAQRLGGVPQPAKEAAALVAMLAGAVEAAHRGGIVHRDLKPSNILLTAEGSPKIADFSLARRFEGDSALTLSSARIGTPSYMAPEQAMGKVGAFCPAVDVYALGAVLYEALTGRPPFRAETPAETQRQVIAEEPAAPSKLNARVPHDLETVCLTALAKDPHRRYATAAAMADDLNRFLRGEPISARPAGRSERAVKWVRRRPAQATVLAAVTLVVAAIIASGTALVVKRERMVRLVTGDLQEVERGRASSNWPEARAALARARVRLGENDGWLSGSEPLQQRLASAERDLDLVARLDAIRLGRSAVAAKWYDSQEKKAAADQAYAAAFKDAGLANDGDDAAAVALRIESSGVRSAVLAALDDWAGCNAGLSDAPRLGWLFDVARRVDPDPTGWRDRVRDPRVWAMGAGGGVPALVDLAAAMPEQERSLSLLTALGERLSAMGQRGAALPFFVRVQRLHPSDFWANFTLGVEKMEADPADASRHLQAAVALRPDESVARANLGISLAMYGHLDEAIEQLHESIRLDPRHSFSHDALGNTLLLQGKRAEAIEEYKLAIAIDPRARASYNNLAKAYAESGSGDAGIDAAIEQYELALKVDPEFAEAHSGLGLMLRKKGRTDDALRHCEEAVRLAPDKAGSHLNLGLVLKDKGLRDEALVHLERAVVLDPMAAECHYSLGTTLAEAGRTAEATDCYREALRCNPKYAPAHHGLGLIAGEERDFDGAISHFRKALEVDPTYLLASGGLGRALMLKGHYPEAREAMLRYADSLPANDPRAVGIGGYIRQCEREMGVGEGGEREK